MFATARRRPTTSRSPSSPAQSPRPEREPSDMAVEMLMRINRGLSTSWLLSIRDQQILYHFLFGRSAAQTGARLGLRETTVHKHLHRIYAKTRTSDRRGLIQLGLALAKEHGITPPPLPKRREVEAPIEDHEAPERIRLSS